MNYGDSSLNKNMKFGLLIMNLQVELAPVREGFAQDLTAPLILIG